MVPRGKHNERGSAFIFCLILAGTAAAVVSTFLGRTLVEHNRVQQRYAEHRAQWRAIGQMEVAKNIIQTAGYTNGNNEAITSALAGSPSFIPGTNVLIQPAGPARWYRMVAAANYDGAVVSTVTFVRDGTSYACYNYYVETQNIGISGETSGRVHSNEKVELHFENGVHHDPVTSSNGFEYMNGATAENTTFLGEVDPAESVKDLLQRVSFSDLEVQANYVAPLGVNAKVLFQGSSMQIGLFEDEVSPTPPPSPELEDPLIDSGEETSDPWGSVGGDPVSLETYDTEGLYYFPGTLLDVKGDVNGHVTLVSREEISITGDLRYQDENGETAYNNGNIPTEAYTPNPEFTRNHSLALIAEGDIRYRPQNVTTMEVNAAMVSTTGTVSFQGTDVNGTEGFATVNGNNVVLDSIRRIGAILSYKRPVVSVLDADGLVVHGFQSGQAFYDAALRITPPPGFPEEPRLQFYYSYQIDPTGKPDAGSGEVGAGVVVLEGFLDAKAEVETIESERGLEWIGETGVTSDGLVSPDPTMSSGG